PAQGDVEGSGPALAPDDLSHFDYRRLKDAENEGIYTEDLQMGQGAPNGAEDFAQTNDMRPDYPFPNPTIMPSQWARDFEYHEPGRIESFLTDNQPGWRRKQGGFTPSNVTYQNIFEENAAQFRPNASPWLAGSQRPDARAFVDLVAKHERDIIER